MSITSLQLEWILTKSQGITKVDEVVQNKSTLTLVIGMQTVPAITVNNVEISQKTKCTI